MSQRDKHKTYNSLIILLKGVIDRMTTIELRNECVVRGVLKFVDSEMNCQLSKVYYRSNKGEECRFEEFYVKGPHIRYVHIPEDLDIMATIIDQLDIHTGATARAVRSQKKKRYDTPSEKLAARRALVARKAEETRKNLEQLRLRGKDELKTKATLAEAEQS